MNVDLSFGNHRDALEYPGLEMELGLTNYVYILDTRSSNTAAIQLQYMGRLVGRVHFQSIHILMVFRLGFGLMELTH